jgi:DNA replication factor GINS
MNLDELQSVRDRERQTDKLQQLRASFYADAGEFVQQLREERERAAERADDPFDAPEVSRLTDEIDTAEQLVEAIYENRIGKIVKLASLDAAGLPADADGLTDEEQQLFETLVDDIEHHRENVLAVLDGTATAGTAGTGDATAETAGADRVSSGDPEPPAPETPAETRDGRADPAAAHERPGGSQSGPTGASSEPGEQTGDTGERVTTADVMGAGGDDPVDGGRDDLQRETERTPDQTGAPAENGDTETATTRPVRNDGGGENRSAADSDSPDSIRDSPSVERETVLVTDTVETFVGFDDRDYDLETDDVVTLPATNAEILVEQDAARPLEEPSPR